MKLMNIPYNNYKTQRCKYFDDNGVCKFGKNCSYAHGDNELRNPYDNLPVPPMFATGMLGEPDIFAQTQMFEMLQQGSAA